MSNRRPKRKRVDNGRANQHYVRPQDAPEEIRRWAEAQLAVREVHGRRATSWSWFGGTAILLHFPGHTMSFEIDLDRDLLEALIERVRRRPVPEQEVDPGYSFLGALRAAGMDI